MATAVLLVTLGGPRKSEEIPGFIRRFVGRELPPAVMAAITERYGLIGGFSPLAAITERQSAALSGLLGDQFLCLPAFRYAQPFIEDALDIAFNSHIDRIVFLIMSPFYNSVTSGNYVATADQYLEKLRYRPEVIVIKSWWEEPLFIDAWAEMIQSAGLDENAFYLFSAHSLPERYSGEPYKSEIEQTVKLIAHRLNLKNYELGWQSVPSKVAEPWIGPEVEHVMDKAAERGVRSIIQVPVGFTADHIETLYDIDITHSRYAAEKGIAYRRVPSLNDSPLFISALKALVDRALEGAEQ